VLSSEWTYSYALDDVLTVGVTCDLREHTFVTRRLVFVGWQTDRDVYLFVRPDGASLPITGESFMWYEVRSSQ
jgi:hypothetical protein